MVLLCFGVADSWPGTEGVSVTRLLRNHRCCVCLACITSRTITTMSTYSSSRSETVHDSCNTALIRMQRFQHRRLKLTQRQQQPACSYLFQGYKKPGFECSIPVLTVDWKLPGKTPAQSVLATAAVQSHPAHCRPLCWRH